MSTITGTASGHSVTAAISFNSPSDGEGIDAVDVNVPFQDLADAVEYLRVYGPHTYGAVTTWTLCGTFDDTTGAGNAQRRLYMGVSGDLAIVTNATWAEGVTTWTQEEAALPSVRYRFDGSGTFVIERVSAGTATFNDGAWQQGFTYNAVTSALRAEGGFGSNAGVSVSQAVAAGTALSAGTSCVAVGNVQSTGGFVIGGLGVQASGGDVTASAGNVIVAGTPVGDAGPGLVKAKRHYSTGTALVAGDLVAGGGWGATAAPTFATNGNDGAFQLTIVAQGGGYAADPVWTLTFKDGTFTRAPVAVVVMSNTTDAAAYVWNVTYTVSATQIVCTMRTAAAVPTAAASYTFSVIVVGV